MFDIGFYELALIGILALLVLGPKRLPEAARTAGLWVGKLRVFIAGVKQDISREIESGELADLQRLKKELNQARSLIEESSNSISGKVDGLAGKLSEEAKRISSRTTKRKKKAARKRLSKSAAVKKKTKSKKRAKKKASVKKKAAKKKSRKRKAR